ncbi:hypothetical protein [Kordia sp.]|uniref:hypothetical protein n=1 Tax=Kordia sp. TaxID=1965332 RepID=UPI003D6AC67C
MNIIKNNSQFRLLDYSEEYSNLVSFGTNKFQSTHRWYSFVEGYSSEFVRRLIGEQQETINKCLEPFGGIGTTALSCQNLGIECYAIESNPFFYNVARAKLYSYSSTKFQKLTSEFVLYLDSCKSRIKLPVLESKTFFEDESKDKWIFHKNVSNAIADILKMIHTLKEEEYYYSILFEIALANILIPFSNVYRNGKCLSYRKNWKERTFTRKQVHAKFLEICNNILIDIRTNEISVRNINNFNTYFQGDSRNKIKDLKDNDFDLVITSPPYLNSRDYTDVYRLELWILGYVKKFDREREIRKSALTSHVQIQLPDTNYPNIREIDDFLEHLKGLNGSLWNQNIPNMIKGYFNDMEGVLSDIHNKLNDKGRAYINVSNSAYGKKICNVDLILAEIAQNLNFNVEEIRMARVINSSSQQKLNGHMRESVIVLSK